MTIPTGLNMACMFRPPLVFDGFNAINGTIINSKSLDTGGIWNTVRSSGTACSVQNGVGSMPINGYAMLITSLNTVQNVSISAAFSMGNDVTATTALVARHDGLLYVAGTQSNYVWGILDCTYGLRILNCINGAQTELAVNSVNKPIKNNTYAAFFNVIGNVASLNVVGLGSVSATLPSITTYSNTGFWLYSPGISSLSTIDNFKVEVL